MSDAELSALKTTNVDLYVLLLENKVQMLQAETSTYKSLLLSQASKPTTPSSKQLDSTKQQLDDLTAKHKEHIESLQQQHHAEIAQLTQKHQEHDDIFQQQLLISATADVTAIKAQLDELQREYNKLSQRYHISLKEANYETDLLLTTNTQLNHIISTLRGYLYKLSITSTRLVNIMQTIENVQQHIAKSETQLFSLEHVQSSALPNSASGNSTNEHSQTYYLKKYQEISTLLVNLNQQRQQMYTIQNTQIEELTQIIMYIANNDDLNQEINDLSNKINNINHADKSIVPIQQSQGKQEIIPSTPQHQFKKRKSVVAPQTTLNKCTEQQQLLQDQIDSPLQQQTYGSMFKSFLSNMFSPASYEEEQHDGTNPHAINAQDITPSDSYILAIKQKREGFQQQQSVIEASPFTPNTPPTLLSNTIVTTAQQKKPPTPQNAILQLSQTQKQPQHPPTPALSTSGTSCPLDQPEALSHYDNDNDNDNDDIASHVSAQSGHSGSTDFEQTLVTILDTVGPTALYPYISPDVANDLYFKHNLEKLRRGVQDKSLTEDEERQILDQTNQFILESLSKTFLATNTAMLDDEFDILDVLEAPSAKNNTNYVKVATIIPNEDAVKTNRKNFSNANDNNLSINVDTDASHAFNTINTPRKHYDPLAELATDDVISVGSTGYGRPDYNSVGEDIAQNAYLQPSKKAVMRLQQLKQQALILQEQHHAQQKLSVSDAPKLDEKTLTPLNFAVEECDLISQQLLLKQQLNLQQSLNNPAANQYPFYQSNNPAQLFSPLKLPVMSDIADAVGDFSHPTPTHQYSRDDHDIASHKFDNINNVNDDLMISQSIQHALSNANNQFPSSISGKPLPPHEQAQRHRDFITQLQQQHEIQKVQAHYYKHCDPYERHLPPPSTPEQVAAYQIIQTQLAEARKQQEDEKQFRIEQQHYAKIAQANGNTPDGEVDLLRLFTGVDQDSVEFKLKLKAIEMRDKQDQQFFQEKFITKVGKTVMSEFVKDMDTYKQRFEEHIHSLRQTLPPEQAQKLQDNDYLHELYERKFRHDLDKEMSQRLRDGMFKILQDEAYNDFQKEQAAHILERRLVLKHDMDGGIHVFEDKDNTDSTHKLSSCFANQKAFDEMKRVMNRRELRLKKEAVKSLYQQHQQGKGVFHTVLDFVSTSFGSK